MRRLFRLSNTFSLYKSCRRRASKTVCEHEFRLIFVGLLLNSWSFVTIPVWLNVSLELTQIYFPVFELIKLYVSAPLALWWVCLKLFSCWPTENPLMFALVKSPKVIWSLADWNFVSCLAYAGLSLVALVARLSYSNWRRACVWVWKLLLFTKWSRALV